MLGENQFLLADLPTSEAAWHDVLEARLADAMLGDDEVITLISADPLLATVGTLASTLASPPRYESGNDRYLLIFGAAPAFDIGAQTQLVADIRAVGRNAAVPDIALYGTGVYSADLQKAVKREATLFSVLAGCGLIGLLLWRFRSIASVASISIPLLVGAAAGACVLTLAYDQVHGIALAFGFTLLGIAVDYPLHTFSHAAHPEGVWPTLRIGVATTMVAYAVFLFGGSPGLAQLGLFAVVGVASAALTTAWMRTNQSPTQGESPRKPLAEHATMCGAKATRLSNWPWILVLLVALPLFLLRPQFSDDLGALTPVPQDVLAADTEIRRRMGTSDMRRLVAVQDNDLETVLRQTEAVARRLDEAREAGALGGYQHVAQLLPSLATQQRRQADVDQLVATGGFASASPFAEAARSLGYAPDAFEPFQARAVAASASAAPLTRERLRANADLAAFIDAHLYEANGVWKSLVFLRDITDSRGIAEHLNTLPGVEMLDLKQASISLVTEFRKRLLLIIGVSLILMVGILGLLTRNVRRSIWVFGTVVAACALAATGTAYLRGSISPFDLMSLALVAGLGLDYSLFFSKPAYDSRDASDTRRAVSICAVSSLLVFGIVSFSSIPVLEGIGTTVTAGVVAAYLLARFARTASA